ncbi:ribulose-phosphate 3-epimerase [Paenibacillus sp. BSR1-1]|uniref:ribulose-phosphate 3-epimerase n=1 Tax=Paenibacillus sp. BSR1-1 TaxID=3020845 RepID=UPI0025B099CC|nr:ribulose-phosphate 3-epimerase [Paenibacillus sp. BSR1-1]MDN3017941.1 ribulose-phosphate 3-epimerase [Paenibacillus sp. BSR1-1]
MNQILPSLFAADIMNLKEECDCLYEEGFDTLHVDMMDGNFVPHIAFGPEQIKSIKKQVKMKLDVHMMVSYPERQIASVLETGAEMISVHYESTPHVRFVIDQIKQHGRKAGVVINPGTDTSLLKPLLNTVDYILIMSINPGRPNQTFIEETIDRIREVKEMIGNRDIQIEVDGGVDEDIARKCIEAGASMIVIGSYLFTDNKAHLKNLKMLEK